jgi:hypothetical protein
MALIAAHHRFDTRDAGVHQFERRNRPAADQGTQFDGAARREAGGGFVHGPLLARIGTGAQPVHGGGGGDATRKAADGALLQVQPAWQARDCTDPRRRSG